MPAAGDLDAFRQQRLTLALQVGAGQRNIAVAIHHPVPWQG